MIRSATVIAALLTLAGCGWSEKFGDFTYACMRGGGMFDGPSCEHRLTDHYSLHQGEGSGDNIVLAFGFGDGGSGGLIDSSGGEIYVRKLGLNDQLLVAQTNRGAIFVAPAKPESWPDLVGPLTEDEFAARYPDAPPWRSVQ